jgi:hypothetical protein
VTRWTKRWAVAASAVAALGATSCSEEARPSDPSTAVTDTPTTTSPGTPTPSQPGPTAPRLPAVANEGSKKGATAYANHYIELLNYATVTGDTAPMRRAASNCSGCDRYVELFESIYSNGGFIETEGWVPFSELVVPQKSRYTVSIQVRSEPQRYRESSASRVRRAGRETYSLNLVLERNGPSWTVVELEGREVQA